MYSYNLQIENGDTKPWKKNQYCTQILSFYAKESKMREIFKFFAPPPQNQHFKPFLDVPIH